MEIDLLPKLFRKVIISQTVCSELSDAEAPNLVRTWIETPPDWLKVQAVHQTVDISISALDPGEQAAIF